MLSMQPKTPSTPYFSVPPELPCKPYVGADPEFFMFSGSRLLPAYKFLPSKDKPFVNYDVVSADDYPYGLGYASLYWEGFQAEYSFDIPHQCLMIFQASHAFAMKAMLKAARQNNEGAKISSKSVVRLSPSTVEDALDPHVALGCEPSKNVYGLKGTGVSNPRLLPYRFAGGHMHFGSKGLPYMTQRHRTIVKTLDKILGVWSVGAAKSFDSPVRRQYYGLAGEYREPKHGLEYRTLSNFWLLHPLVFHTTWELARRCLFLAMTEFHDLWVGPEELIIETIQNNDIQTASKLMELNKPLFQWLFHQRGWDANTIDGLYNMGIDGIERFVKDPDDVVGNWGLEPRITLDPRDECHPRLTWNGYMTKTYPKKI